MDGDLHKRLTAFRRELHQYPEIGFEEFETRERIKKILMEFGIKENQMKEYEPTILCVYISGKGASFGDPRCIGLRADMDALPMVEKNEHLEYRSKI